LVIYSHLIAGVEMPESLFSFFVYQRFSLPPVLFISVFEKVFIALLDHEIAATVHLLRRFGLVVEAEGAVTSRGSQHPFSHVDHHVLAGERLLQADQIAAF